MTDKHSLEYKINSFLEEWSNEDLTEFFNYIEYMLELCVVDKNGESALTDFEKKDETEKNTLRLIRLAYTLSLMGDKFAGKFAMCKVKYKNLSREMELQGSLK